MKKTILIILAGVMCFQADVTYTMKAPAKNDATVKTLMLPSKKGGELTETKYIEYWPGTNVPTQAQLSRAELAEYDIQTNVLPQQCALLAQAITAKFPMSAYPNYITTEKAVENLIEMAKVSQENELVRITPVSIEVKNIPAEVVQKLSQGFLDQWTQEILSCLYKKQKCPIFRASIENVCSIGYGHLPKWLSAVHPTIKKFIEDKCLRKSSKMVESWERMPGSREYEARMFNERFGY